MQILIDIPEEDVAFLDKLSEDRQVPRDELVRTAVSCYVEAQRSLQLTEAERNGILDEAFGSWASFPEDGLAYQERIRAEWER